MAYPLLRNPGTKRQKEQHTRTIQKHTKLNATISEAVLCAARAMLTVNAFISSSLFLDLIRANVFSYAWTL